MTLLLSSKLLSHVWMFPCLCNSKWGCWLGNVITLWLCRYFLGSIMSLCFYLCSRFRRFSAASLSGYSVRIHCLYQMLGISFMAGCLTHIIHCLYQILGISFMAGCLTHIIHCLYQMLGIIFMAGCLTHVSLAIQCPVVWLPDVPELDMIPGSCSKCHIQENKEQANDAHASLACTRLLVRCEL